MQVFIQKTGKTLDVEHTGSASALLERIGVSPEVVLIIRDGLLITEHDTVDGAQRIELLSVISGG